MKNEDDDDAVIANHENDIINSNTSCSNEDNNHCDVKNCKVDNEEERSEDSDDKVEGEKMETEECVNEMIDQDHDKENEGNNSLLSRLNVDVEEATEADGQNDKLNQNGIQLEKPKVRKRVRIKLPATDDEEDSDDGKIEVDQIVESGEVCYLFEESKFDSEPDLTKVPSAKRVRVVRIKERKPVKAPIIFYPRPDVPKDEDSDQEKKDDEEAERAKVEKLKKRLEKRRARRRMFRERKRYWIAMILKAVRYFMIAVSIVSVPVDLWKLVDGIIKSQNALDGPTALEYFDFYSATIGTHIIGGAGAIESDAFLTVASRLASTWLYQVDQWSKNSSEGPPSDPKQIQKWIKEKVPRHRLPKGYKFPKEDETTQSTMEDDYMGGMGGMGGYPGMDGMYPGMDGLGGFPGGRRSKALRDKLKNKGKTGSKKSDGKKSSKKKGGTKVSNTKKAAKKSTASKPSTKSKNKKKP